MGLTAAVTTSGVRERALAYATLVRLPNLFTAPPDVVAGAALVAAAGASPAPVAVAGLGTASALVYAAGTTLNDYFDADVDAVERPERPIPSGRVSPRSALAFGVALLVGGIAVAASSGGFASGVVAAVLSGLVVLYDGVLEDTAAGFATMGATRGTNVALGASLGLSATALSPRVVVVTAAVTVYVAAVTWMASKEARGGERSAVAAVGATAAAIAVVPPVLTVTAGSDFVGTAAGNDLVGVAAGSDFVGVAVGTSLSVLFLWFVGRVLVPAYREPIPDRIGPAVGQCVLGLVLFEGAVAAVAGVGWALTGVAFFAPAVALTRIVDVS